MSGSNRRERVDILLVEDNPGDVRLVEEAFDTANYDTEIHTVTDGTEALEYLTESLDSESVPVPDLTFLDLDLPRKDGFAVLQELCESSRLSAVPVIVFTNSGAEKDVLKSYELSANCYITKPEDLDEFDVLVDAVEEFWFEAARLPPG